MEGEEEIKKSSGIAYLYAYNVLNLSNRDAEEWSR